MTQFTIDNTYRENQTQADDEIDLIEIVSIFSRRWRWIASSSTIGLILSGCYLIIAKPVYQGEFQIVIKEKTDQTNVSSLLSRRNSSLAMLAGLNGASGGNTIGTELQILNSPSVLRPVFDAVKARKPPAKARRMRFEKWAKKAITAEEKKRDTSVLNVEFRDTDRQLVLPITQMISDTYQSYSNRGRARELANVITYIKEQIALIKPKAKESSRAALNYGTANSLGLMDGLPISGNLAGAGASKDKDSRGDQIMGRGGAVEAARTSTQLKIKALEVQILEARKAKSGSIYFASQLAALTDKSSTFDQLTSVESQLAELRSRLTDADPLVQKLQRQRNTLVSYINQQTISLLNGELDLAKANLQSLNRPEGVISRHRELTQEALRDEATLVTLQNQLKQFELEQARATSPWELISSPTLLDKPVAPSIPIVLALGLLAGVSIGTGTALVAERRTGLVFSLKELQSQMPCPLLQQLPTLNRTSWKDVANLLASGPLCTATSNSAIALVPVGDVPSDQLEDFASQLRQSLGNRKLLVSNDLTKTGICATQVLITAPGVATRNQLNQLCKALSLQGAPVAGWLLLDPKLQLS